MRFENGKVPLDLLVRRPARGKDFCLMMPGTAVKHDRLVALAAARFDGWVPVVSGPDDAYRRLAVQQYYSDTMPPGMAAWPGTSSHGGSFEGMECGAVDYGNWGEIGRAPWFQLARDAGFEPGFFNGQYGRPVEPWHVIDRTPWHVPGTPKPEIEIEEDDDMSKMKGARYVRAADKKTVYVLFNEGSGFYSEHTTGAGGDYNNPLARNWETGSWPEISESHAGALQRNLALVRRGE